jgi:hypothetical protein
MTSATRPTTVAPAPPSGGTVVGLIRHPGEWSARVAAFLDSVAP